MSETAHELGDDPELGALVEEHGPLTLEPATDTFRRFVASVIAQQVSTAAAESIRKRVFDSFEITPETIAAADRSALQAAGLSKQKAEYVTHIAEAYLEYGYDRAYFAGMDDEAVIEELTEIHGVGTWTAKMFLIFCLGRKDVFPVEDLGVRNGMQQLYGDLSRTEMCEVAERWRPHRSYAALYLWKAGD
ncbi:MAG: DNA-3-methyladenine glycosylase [Natronomonas sp.]